MRNVVSSLILVMLIMQFAKEKDCTVQSSRLERAAV